MKGTIINTLGRTAWGVVVVLLGLLLSSGESLLIDASLARGSGRGIPMGQGETAFKTLPTDCLALATIGAIPAFDTTKIGCDRTTAIPSEKDDGLKSLQLEMMHLRVNLLQFLQYPIA